MQCFFIIFFNKFNVSTENDILSNDNFLNIIVFYVKVPVLSVKTYDILPNSSGIVLFLANDPSISLSFDIPYEKYNFEKSKFTLNDIGIIELNNKICLNNYNNQPFYKPLLRTIQNAVKTNKQHSILAN